MIEYVSLRHMEKDDIYHYMRLEVSGVPEKYAEQAKQIDGEKYDTSGFFVCMHHSLETGDISVLDEVPGCELYYTDFEGNDIEFPYSLTAQEEENLLKNLVPDMEEWLGEYARERAAARQEPVIQYGTLEHSDDFGAEVVCWIDVSNVPEDYKYTAALIDGEDYDDGCFGVCLVYDKETEKFHAIEDKPNYNLYYVDNGGEKHWMPYVLSESELELLSHKVKDEMEQERQPERAR